MNVDKVMDLLQKHPLLDETTTYGYGTAGFRFKVEHMYAIMLRVGIASAYLLGDTEDMGVMVTASHNDESYNGVKLSNPDGSMIPSNLERILVNLVNERNLDVWRTQLATTFHEKQSSSSSLFHVGYDTRSHSKALTDLLIQGATAVGVSVKNHGVLTTPMLHHIVLHSNSKQYLPLSISPCPSRNGYTKAMAQAYLDLLEQVTTTSQSGASSARLMVDCACGVGYKAVQEVVDHFLETRPNTIVPLNQPGEGPLNTNCGSEHVQKQLEPPTWYQSATTTTTATASTTTMMNQDYCCSVDGDADRIVFFSFNNNSKLTLLDGDKIAVLIGQFLKEQLHAVYEANPQLPKVTVGVVQTAYANGASTNYLQEHLKLPVVITKTGVKHLHHAALEFDVGIYFEANGHGTVLFSDKYHKFAAEAKSIRPALEILPRLINPAVGDAISDLLLVDALLQHYQWTLKEWNALYTDLPSRQLKISVKDRSVVKCNENETKCLAPNTLQPALDQLMATTKNSRTFCRASGTENVVRVYAEAPTREQADKVATMASALVYEHCGGVGPQSSI